MKDECVKTAISSCKIRYYRPILTVFFLLQSKHLMKPFSLVFLSKSNNTLDEHNYNRRETIILLLLMTDMSDRVINIVIPTE